MQDTRRQVDPARTLDEATLRTTMRDAVDRGEFRVYYQPIVGFDRAEVIGFEALLRWEHPEFGVLTPAQFLASRRGHGLIVPIGSRRPRRPRAGRPRSGRARATDGPAARRLGQPLRPPAGRRHDLHGAVTHALTVSGLDPHLLVLEVTESDAARPVGARCAPVLRELRVLGVQLSVDDFGARHTLVAHAARPARRLAEDRPVVRRRSSVETPTTRRSSPRSSRSPTRSVLDVTAEGIDTARQLSEVRSLGCDRGQGCLLRVPAAR